ncbi:MAG: hypothetical protein NTV51_15765, partial [Verrucomicrobia bacterium]|nr:hypothetical protein [Verrucomicrobiota bacterium]
MAPHLLRRFASVSRLRLLGWAIGTYVAAVGGLTVIAGCGRPAPATSPAVAARPALPPAASQTSASCQSC